MKKKIILWAFLCTFIQMLAGSNTFGQIANAGPNVTICNNDSVQLNATGGGSYIWSTGDTIANPWVSPTKTTTYYLTVSNSVGAELICNGDFELGDTCFTSSFNKPSCYYAPYGYNIPKEGDYGITTYSGPGFHPNFVNCFDHTNAPTGNMMCVNGPGGVPNMPVWSQTVPVTPNTNYNFSAWIQSTCNHDPAVLIFTINGAIIGPSFIASTPTTCVWQNYSVTWNSGSNTTATICIVDQNTVFSGNDFALDDISFKSSNGGVPQYDYDTVTVTVVAGTKPIAYAGPDTAICAGDSIGLVATGAGTGGIYIWSTGQVNQVIGVSPMITTTYTVTVTNSNGCLDSDEIVVAVLAVANAGIDQTISNGAVATLTASGGGTYVWNTSETSASITVSPVLTTTYTVTVTNGGCTGTDEVIVFVCPIPVADAGIDQTICLGDSAFLSATGGGWYLWSTGDTTASMTVSPLITTTYTVTVINGSGCTDTDDVLVTVLSSLPVNLGPDTCICQGDSMALFASGGAGYSYFWSTGAMTQVILINPIVNTTYTVTVTDVNGCTGTDDIAICVVPNPIADFYTKDTICANFPVSFSDSSLYATYWYWNFGDGTSDIIQNPTHTYTNKGTYNVLLVVANATGCVDSLELTIFVDSCSLYNLGGQVFKDNLPIDFGLAYLYSIDGNIVTPIDTTVIDTLGYYDFYQVPAGNYIVKAALSPNSVHYNQCVATYYISEKTWKKADIITLTKDIWNADIYMKKIKGAIPGPGNISGTITQGPKKGTGDPIEDMEVLLLDYNDSLLSIAYSDASGDYSFNNIAYGTYKIYVDVAGKVTTPAIVTIDASNSDATDVNIFVNSTTVTTSIKNSVYEVISGVGNIYPNPVSHKANIEVSLLKASDIQINIYNFVGQSVYAKNESLGAGSHILQLDTDMLPEGVYNLQITSAEGAKVIKRFVRIK